jgi:hypothetical protein
MQRANRPAPPAPRIRRSVSRVFGAIAMSTTSATAKADRIEQRLRIDQQEAGDHQHQPLERACA